MAMQTLPRPRIELRRAIGASGMPAWQIGHLAGISPTVLSHIATGRREPRPEEAQSLATVLEVPVDALFPAED
jgi:transcriptional regulator with XRE-family HTH domain